MKLLKNIIATSIVATIVAISALNGSSYWDRAKAKLRGYQDTAAGYYGQAKTYYDQSQGMYQKGSDLYQQARGSDLYQRATKTGTAIYRTGREKAKAALERLGIYNPSEEEINRRMYQEAARQKLSVMD